MMRYFFGRPAFAQTSLPSRGITLTGECLSVALAGFAQRFFAPKLPTVPETIDVATIAFAAENYLLRAVRAVEDSITTVQYKTTAELDGMPVFMPD